METKRTCTRIGWLLAVAGGCIAGAAERAEAQILEFQYLGAPYTDIGTVCAAGDIDGDGCNDFIIGAPWSDSNGDGALGDVFVYSGRTGALYESFSSSVYGMIGFGQAVAGDGDFDGDGTPDILIGSWRDFLSGNEAGSIEIYSGRTGQHLLHLDGTANSVDWFGWSVAYVGDLDGDGTAEFIVGAMGGSYAKVFRGGDGALLCTVNGQSSTSWFGSSVCGVGDVNKDGVPDFVVGEPLYDLHIHGLPVVSDVGRSSVYSGADFSLLWSATGLVAGAWFGLSTSGVGDVDGDGAADLIVGAPHDTGGGSATVYSGATSFALYTEVNGHNPNLLFGWSVSGVHSDINHDGVPDYIVGAPGYDPNDWVFGSGYVETFSGKDGHALGPYTPGGFANCRQYGNSVSGADFNGDSYADIIIGYPGFDFTGAQNGRVDVYDGCPGFWENYGAGWPGTNGVPGFTVTGYVSKGTVVDLNIDNSRGVDTTGFLFVGLQEASTPTKYGGTLLVNSLYLLPMSVPAAGLTVTDMIPPTTPMDTNIYLQMLELDPGASKGVSFTEGVRLHVGYLYQ